MVVGSLVNPKCCALRKRGKWARGGNANEERRVGGKKGKDGEGRGGKEHVGERREIRNGYAINIDGSPEVGRRVEHRC